MKTTQELSDEIGTATTQRKPSMDRVRAVPRAMAPTFLPPASATPQGLLARKELVQDQVVGVGGHARVMETGRPRLQLRETRGSGVLLAPGLVATSLDLILLMDNSGRLRGMDEICIHRPETRPDRARVLRMFPTLGLALLRVEGAPVDEPAAEFAAYGAAPGDLMLAFSRAGGYLEVAAVRCLAVESGTPGLGLIHLDDARIDSSFIGGPLFNAHSRLQGILVTGRGALVGLPVASLCLAIEADLKPGAESRRSGGRHDPHSTPRRA